MREEALKVFIGPARITNMGSVLASAFRERGVKVTHAINQISPERAEAGMQYDILMNLEGHTFRGLNMVERVFRFLHYFVRFFPRHNAFIFVAGISLLPYNLDLPLLKLFRKKTVMLFTGSDIRHYESLAAAATKAGIKHFASKDERAGPEALNRKLRMISMVERYVDHIGSGSSYSQLLSREYFRIRAPLDIRNIRYNNTPNSRPIIVHAPSHDAFKGTSHIVEAIDQLETEGYDLEFRLFRNVSNTKLREALSEADISVDQLFGLAPGVFALESMAAGCVVLGSSYPEFAGFPPELPVIHTDPDNIYQNLKMLLENPELRRELGERGRQYVEKYHDHRKIADDFIRLLTTGEADITFDPGRGADGSQGQGNGSTER